MAQQHGDDHAAAVALVEASDLRWTAGDDPQFDRAALERFAHAYAFATDEPPRWIETVSYPGLSGSAEIEVRVLTASALVVVTAPWATGDDGPEPSVRLLPLRHLRALEVDGFVYDGAGLPEGCTITLLFEDGLGVRLGASPGADRTAMAALLPALRGLIGIGPGL